MSMTHLREVARLTIHGDCFVRRGEQLLVTKRWGSPPHALSVVDVESAEAPRLASSLPFHWPMQSAAAVDDLLYVFESERAIHLVDATKAPPVTPDVHLMFRQQLFQMERVGTRWLVAAANFAGVSVLDISNPLVPVETARRKLGDSYVESFAVSGERIFAAANGDGLVELGIDADGALVEVGRWLGGEDGFSVQHVFVVGDRLWVFGSGTLPFAKGEDEEDEDEDEAEDDEDGEYEEEEEEANTVVFALSDSETPVWIGATPSMPKRMRALPDGGAIAIDGYRCYQFPPTGKATRLFELQETRPDWQDDKTEEPRRYVEVNATTDCDSLPRLGVTDDAACWLRRGQHLFVQRSDSLTVYAISPDSPLAQMAED